MRFVKLSIFEQCIACINGFVIKPIYMLLTGWLIKKLSGRREPEVKAFQIGLLSFLLGEMSCAVNFIFHGMKSKFFEFVHSIGMVVSFCFFAYSSITFADKRVLGVTEEKSRCTLIRFCRNCTKEEEDCKLKPLLLFFCFFMSFLSLMPFLKPIIKDRLENGD
ncbi:hypothetical protein ACFL35_06075 [Candidatus Riflebacteria bacterium]